jgi:hypothetical protein
MWINLIVSEAATLMGRKHALFFGSRRCGYSFPEFVRREGLAGADKRVLLTCEAPPAKILKAFLDSLAST